MLARIPDDAVSFSKRALSRASTGCMVELYAPRARSTDSIEMRDHGAVRSRNAA
jgi:hypothetical protein